MSNKEEERVRPILLVCGHCKHHDIEGHSLLEINFSSGTMSYVCRNCNKENITKMNNQPASLPKINVRR